MEEQLNSIKLKESYNGRYSGNVRRDDNSTLGDYFKKMNKVQDPSSIKSCNLRDILMIALNGQVETYGDGYFFDKVSQDYVFVDGEKMMLLQNVGNVKTLDYSVNGAGKVSYKEEKENVVLYGDEKIYVFLSPFEYYKFERDEMTKIMAKNENSELMFLGAPADITNVHFEMPVVAETYHSADLKIQGSEEGKIMVVAANKKNSGIEIGAEDALGIIKGTGTKIDKMNENERYMYNKLLKSVNRNQEHNISEVAETVADRRQENINKVVSEISETMQEKLQDNEQIKD